MKICLSGRFRPRCLVLILAVLLLPAAPGYAQQTASPVSPGSASDQPLEGSDTDADRIVVTATRLPVAEDQSPADVTVIPAEEMAERQTDRVADALRDVPGLSVVQTGSPGQLTSVFIRGLESQHTQVLIDGVPINQGLDGAFNFADLTSDGLGRVEVDRGPQSTLYGPSALAGTIQLFTRRGDETNPPQAITYDASAEGGTFDTYRERLDVAGVLGAAPPAPSSATTGTDGKDGKNTTATPAYNSPGVFDYSVAFSRLDTDNDRQNNDYRNTAVLANVGFAPRALALGSLGGTAPRFGFLTTYSVSVAASPDDIYDFRPIDRLTTERQLYAPNVDWQITRWWHQHLVLDYDTERQVDNPNQDGFDGPTRGQFYRYQLDDQNDFIIARWLTLTLGVFYTQDFAYQREPFVTQSFGPEPQYTKDFTDEVGVFGQFSITPFKNALLVVGGRFDDFNRFGGQYTYRVAGSYLVQKTGTTLRSSVATGFSPPTPQDRIFGNNLDLDPEKDFGYDFGFEQGLFKDRLRFGSNYFHNDLTNTIGYTSDFLKLENLGSARTLGIEAFARWEPVSWLFLRSSYTWLDAVSTSNANVDLPEGSRLLRQPRNEFFASLGVRPYKGLSVSMEVKEVNAREDIDPRTFARVDARDYHFLRLLADYAITERVHVYGRIDNLTDEHYQEVFGYPALGRGFFGGAAVHF